MMYLTYDEYENMGGSMDDALFPRFELKARKRIDAMTFGRVAGEKPARQSVKMCAYELIGAMYADETGAGLSGREVAAVSNDGVSVTYATGGTAGARYANIVRAWLTGETDANGVHLLYCGV